MVVYGVYDDVWDMNDVARWYYVPWYLHLGN
jgi:hypothetical protein